MNDVCAVSLRPSTESGLRPVDLLLRTGPGATVADLAAALGASLGGERPGLLVVPVDETGTPWPAGRELADTPLAGGDLLDVVTVPASWADRPAAPSRRRAVLRIVAGPDAGRLLAVASSSVLIGRGPRCGLRLSDPLVSREHARLSFERAGCPQLADSGSAHGTLLDGTAVRGAAAPVAWGARIRLGDTTIVVEPARADEQQAAPRDQGVLRPPRFGDPLETETLDVPPPPEPREPPDVPWTALAMPLVLGASLLSASNGLGALAYIVGYPLIAMFGYQLTRRATHRHNRRALAAWRLRLDALVARLQHAAARQRAIATDDGPPLGDLTTRALVGDPHLWCRRSDGEDFLRIRLGTGPVPALLSGHLRDGADDEQRAHAQLALSSLAVLQRCPVTIDLAQERLLGIVGAAADVDDVARAVLLRLCLDHSPAEVTVCAALGRDRAAAETWLRWLPHCVARPGGLPPVAVGEREAEALLAAVSAEGDGGHTICVIDDALDLPRRLIEAIAAGEGRVHVIWLGASAATAPSRTGVVLDLDATITRTPLAPGEARPATARAAGLLGRRDRGGVQVLDLLDRMSLELAWTLGRTMTSWTDAAALVPSISSLPPVVTLGEVLPEMPDPDDARLIGERWRASTGLRAQLGVGPDGPMSIDLREDGPHALVAGTTGGGKSELLQTLICSLSLTNPPSRVTFLLVDYKGGAAFRECAELPHTVGYITDLTPALVVRALASMGAEITRREGLLARYAAKDLVTLERSHPEVAPPSLVICVDEFAALTQEVPDFVDGMVNIAQRGRSLGLHLILATQRPAGVVTPAIRANTDLRICLRVASPDDSLDVLDARNAAAISRATPGRAWMKRTGHGSLEPIQVAYLGGRRPLLAERPPVEVELLTARPLPASYGPATGDTRRLHPRTDLARVVDSVRAAFEASGAPAPLQPWLAPLPETLRLVELLADAPTGRPGTAVIGRCDLPREQAQPHAVADLAKGGHLLVFGASGSGKTELLRTAAVALTLTPDPGGPPSVYGVDAAGGGLGRLAAWPATGAVIALADRGRLLRLLRMLSGAVHDRDRLLAAHGVPDLAALPADVRPGRLYLLIDDMIALVDELEGGGPTGRRHVDHLAEVLAGGRRVGIHVLATTARRSGLTSALTAHFGQRMVLRMNTADDYAMLGIPNGVLDNDSPPGRGMLEGVSVQIAAVSMDAAPGGTAFDGLAVDGLAFDGLAQRVAGGARGGVPPMPDRVPAPALPAGTRGRISVGVDADLVVPVQLDLLAGPLLVAGRAGSGRTSILAGIAELAVGGADGPGQVILAGPRAASFPRPDLVDRTLDTVAAVTAWLAESPATSGWELLLLDDAHLWERAYELDAEARAAVAALAVRAEADPGRLAVVVAADSDDARTRSHIPGTVQVARKSRRAILLSADMGDGTLAGVTVPMHTTEAAVGPGRGLLCQGGAFRLVHAVTAGPVPA